MSPDHQTTSEQNVLETQCEQNHWNFVSFYSISQNIKGNTFNKTLQYFVENWQIK